MIEVKYNQQSYNRLINTIEKLQKNIKDMTPIWDQFYDYYRSDIIESGGFDAKGKVFGERWPKYSEKYKKFKKGGSMLVVSGKLKEDATKNLQKEIKKDKLIMTVNNKLAAIHQFGASNGVPARPYAMKKDKTLPQRAIVWLIERMYEHIKGDWK